jgi:hypothetical protein
MAQTKRNAVTGKNFAFAIVFNTAHTSIKMRGHRVTITKTKKV